MVGAVGPGAGCCGMGGGFGGIAAKRESGRWRARYGWRDGISGGLDDDEVKWSR